ncbi:MoaD/ThiS family protein [candidate division KSB1 bacterium]|nr:MoaD/ThiS family protein [candidate division KSB1 bacterium]
MSVTVLIPTPLRSYTDHQQSIEIDGQSVDEILNKLMNQYPLLRKQICTEDGTIRRFVNIFLNDEDVRFLEKDKTPVRELDVISIIPSIAGG